MSTRAVSSAPTGACLKIGLVGGGKMARHHARSIDRARGATLVAIADPNAVARNEVISLFPDVEAYSSLAELLESGVADVVHICTPPGSHVALARQALQGGCHIYVEKPFAPTTDEAAELLGLAEQRGLRVCAGHQLLFERPCRIATELLPAVGRVTHVESFFSFRTVRRAPGGRVPLRSDLQLLDILPHPVYLLLHFLELARPGESTRMTSLEIGDAGTIHALVRRGTLTANLTVSLEARPIESFVRISGSNGSLYADFVRGTVQRLIGPGFSGIDKILAPYRTSLQQVLGTTSAVFARVMKRQKSYPGLVEVFEAFYTAVTDGTPSPTSPESIVGTVQVWEEIADHLEQAEHEQRASLVSFEPHAGSLVVTGGTGFLGREVCKAAQAAGMKVTVLARREPAAWERIPGVEYLSVDLASPIPAGVIPDADALIHTAAETAGSWDEHQSNSIDATRNVLEAAAAAGITDVIHLSSVAVLAAPFGRAIRDDESLKADSKSYGPYIWGKLESEQVARATAETLGLRLRVVRPGPIVDFAEFEPPGRLGKRLGGLFVAVGRPGQELAVVDVRFAAEMLVWMAANPEAVPAAINLLNPDPPTKRQLIRRLRDSNPGLRIVWLPGFVLTPLSLMAVAAQKVLRPRRPAINVARVFAVQPYDTAGIKTLAAKRELSIDRPAAPSVDSPRLETHNIAT